MKSTLMKLSSTCKGYQLRYMKIIYAQPSDPWNFCNQSMSLVGCYLYICCICCLLLPGWHLHTGLLLSQAGGEVHVHVRVGDWRPGVQQRAEQPGDGGHHLLQVREKILVIYIGIKVLDTNEFCVVSIICTGHFLKETSSAGTESPGPWGHHGTDQRRRC